MKRLKRLLIIPARIGSKRIKKKNIKLFYGKPIINYSIDTSLKSNLFDEIHVSTDSPLITEKLKKKIKIKFIRPKYLSGDNVPLKKVFYFVLNKYQEIGYEFDELWFMSSCAPLIDAKDLIKASKFFSQNKKSFISVSKHPAPIEWAFEKNNKNKLTPVLIDKINTNSQKLKTSYYDSGLFGAFKTKIVKNNFRSFKNDFYAYEIPFYKAIDVDDIHDWKTLKFMYKAFKFNR